jgi:hypothetical protein
MISISEKEEILASAVAGIPRIAELLASFPAEDRTRALDAAKRSYLKTVHDLGYGEAAAQKWVFAVMRCLRTEVGEMIVNEAIENIAQR